MLILSIVCLNLIIIEKVQCKNGLLSVVNSRGMSLCDRFTNKPATFRFNGDQPKEKTTEW